METNHNWSRKAVVYHIYPRSFKDSNGDGVGDLKGITQKLDYLNDGTENSLGIGAIWLSPFYESPMADFGYDISDYCAVDPIFGTLEDFKELAAEAHKRGIKVIVDFVPNHTSAEHPWFSESRSSRHNPKRNWYLWANAKPDGSPPNNWLSVFGGSGWQWDPGCKQYYFHSFLKEQPDLNWANPEVRQAMTEVLKFWLKLGVDGFRVDAVHHLVKDPRLRDEPGNPNYNPGMDDPYNSLLHIYSQGQDETLQVLNEFCLLLERHPDTFMVTEVHADIAGLSRYYRACANGLHSPFNFNLIGMPWNAGMYHRFIEDFEASLSPNDWPNYVLGNHDKPRVASRIGKDRARAAAMLLMTLRGMPFVYYGEELGMEDAAIPKELVKDPFEKNVPGFKLGRDPQRTPMQWDGSVNAGFTAGVPWLPVPASFEQINAEAESRDPKSLLNLYKALIHFRNKSEALLNGGFDPLNLENGEVLAFTRLSAKDQLFVIINFSGAQQAVFTKFSQGKLVLSTFLDREPGCEVNLSSLILRPNEGLLVSIVP